MDMREARPEKRKTQYLLICHCYRLGQGFPFQIHDVDIPSHLAQMTRRVDWYRKQLKVEERDSGKGQIGERDAQNSDSHEVQGRKQEQDEQEQGMCKQRKEQGAKQNQRAGSHSGGRRGKDSGRMVGPHDNSGDGSTGKRRMEGGASMDRITRTRKEEDHHREEG
eukprot:6745812-Heterocapsa_arctica.AAC.1